MKASRLKKTMFGIVISSLLLVAACAGGEVQTYRPTSYPVYRSQEYYYPDLNYQTNDPQFWQMWQDRSGGG